MYCRGMEATTEKKKYPMTQLQSFSIADAVAAHYRNAEREIKKYPACEYTQGQLERAKIAKETWDKISYQMYDVYNDDSALEWQADRFSTSPKQKK